MKFPFYESSNRTTSLSAAAIQMWICKFDKSVTYSRKNHPTWTEWVGREGYIFQSPWNIQDGRGSGLGLETEDWLQGRRNMRETKIHAWRQKYLSAILQTSVRTQREQVLCIVRRLRIQTKKLCKSTMVLCIVRRLRIQTCGLAALKWGDSPFWQPF